MIGHLCDTTIVASLVVVFILKEGAVRDVVETVAILSDHFQIERNLKITIF